MQNSVINIIGAVVISICAALSPDEVQQQHLQRRASAYVLRRR